MSHDKSPHLHKLMGSHTKSSETAAHKLMRGHHFAGGPAPMNMSSNMPAEKKGGRVCRATGGRVRYAEGGAADENDDAKKWGAVVGGGLGAAASGYAMHRLDKHIADKAANLRAQQQQQNQNVNLGKSVNNPIDNVAKINNNGAGVKLSGNNGLEQSIYHSKYPAKDTLNKAKINDNMNKAKINPDLEKTALYNDTHHFAASKIQSQFKKQQNQPQLNDATRSQLMDKTKLQVKPDLNKTQIRSNAPAPVKQAIGQSQLGKTTHATPVRPGGKFITKAGKFAMGGAAKVRKGMMTENGRMR